jgi:serine/threonine-protein kinase
MMAAAVTEVIPEVDGGTDHDGTRVLGGPVTGPATGHATGAVNGAATGAVTGVNGVAGPRTGGRHAAGPRTMPPLQGPPVDGDDGDWDEPDRRGAGGRRWALVLASLAIVAAVAAGAWFLLAGNGEDAGTSAGATTTSSAPTSDPAGPTQDLVTIPAAAEFVGEDADDVEGRLLEAGLDVTRVDASDEQLAAAGLELQRGQVVAVDPAGIPVPRGTTVTLAVAAADYSPEEAEETEAPADPGTGDTGQDDGTGDTGTDTGSGEDTGADTGTDTGSGDDTGEDTGTDTGGSGSGSGDTGTDDEPAGQGGQGGGSPSTPSGSSPSTSTSPPAPGSSAPVPPSTDPPVVEDPAQVEGAPAPAPDAAGAAGTEGAPA